MCSRALNGLFSTLLIRIRSPTLFPKKFSPGQPSARTPCASSAISAVLTLKRCTVNFDNVLGGIASQLQPSGCSNLVSLNTFNRFVTLLETWPLHLRSRTQSLKSESDLASALPSP